jgi:hypothetical protein
MGGDETTGQALAIAESGSALVDASDRSLPARAREILQHYLENPQTADNLEGIAEWRLLDDFVQRRVADTNAALEWLVKQGFLTKTVGPASPPVYRLNPATIAEAEHLIEESESPARGEA